MQANLVRIFSLSLIPIWTGILEKKTFLLIFLSLTFILIMFWIIELFDSKFCIANKTLLELENMMNLLCVNFSM